jgi:hypothetical protein
MAMANVRGYVVESEDSDNEDSDREDSDNEIKAEIRREMIAKLAREWNQINNRIEIESFDDELQGQRADYHAEMADEYVQNCLYGLFKEKPNVTPEEKAAFIEKAQNEYYKKVSQEENKIYLQKQVIEELLGNLGARMMRPYEHHNEMEGYYRYMENRYNNDRDW